jgi:hypothetical protein
MPSATDITLEESMNLTKSKPHRHKRTRKPLKTPEPESLVLAELLFYAMMGVPFSQVPGDNPVRYAL